MLALDFKLTSGQVRTLLAVASYELLTLEERRPLTESPVFAFFNAPSFIPTVQSLTRKGLVVHKMNKGDGWQWTDNPLNGHSLTPTGRAFVEVVQTQARHIVALADLSAEVRAKVVRKRAAKVRA